MQALQLQNRSFASMVVALAAAGVLLLGGAGGYAIRAATSAVVSSVRTIQAAPVPSAPASITTRPNTHGQQP
jgi:hypothetical protein